MNAIRIEGKIIEVTCRTNNDRTVVNVKLHDVVNNEHNVYYDISFWGQEAENAKSTYKAGDTVAVTGKLKVKPYVGRNGNKNLTLVVYDICSFENESIRQNDHSFDSDINRDNDSLKP